MIIYACINSVKYRILSLIKKFVDWDLKLTSVILCAILLFFVDFKNHNTYIHTYIHIFVLFKLGVQCSSEKQTNQGSFENVWIIIINKYEMSKTHMKLVRNPNNPSPQQ